VKPYGPTLAILGENTAPTFPERLHLLSAWLPNAEHSQLPNATHVLHLQNPRGMAGALTSFYAQVSAHKIHRLASRPRAQHPSRPRALVSASPSRASLAEGRAMSSRPRATAFRLIASVRERPVLTSAPDELEASGPPAGLTPALLRGLRS
jgi:hypothetical protein